MATKRFCDACGADCAEKGYNTYEYLCHLDSFGMDGFTDREGNRVSRRSVQVDLCNHCYNIVVSPSVAKLKQIQKENECLTSTQSK